MSFLSGNRFHAGWGPSDGQTGPGASPPPWGSRKAISLGPVTDQDSGTTLSPSAPLDPEVADELLALLEQMAIIRATENAAQSLFLSGLVKGTTHLAAGQEAVAVGASAALRPDDYVFATYRGHHHAIARGLAPEFCLAELMSKATGCCGAKGGSMHLTHTAGNMLGSYAIVGAHLPMACGAAWSAKLRGTQQVAVAFFGDGATNIGAFHEALNLAAVWALPAIFICENNLYMEYTPIKDVTAVPRPAADRAGSYGLPAIVVDGNDVLAVRSAVEEAVTRARSGIGPTIIEAETYRHYGHSRDRSRQVPSPGRSRALDGARPSSRHSGAADPAGYGSGANQCGAHQGQGSG